MASTQKKYIGLLGGSFDPAHKGHLSISKIAIKNLKLKKIYWIITKKNPFKNKTFYSLEERIKYAKKITKAQIVIPNGPRLGSKVIEVSNLQKAMGDKLLIENLSFSLPPGGIVGVIGPNGAGKSTLFKMLTKELSTDTGDISMGETVQLSYVDQSRDDLKDNETVWEAISGGAEIIELGDAQVNSRAYCSSFNFKGGDQQKKLSLLSGGERNRVHMARLLKEGGNVLLLDEPTNDLDVETLRALEDALVDFAGCAVVISHDRFFLDRICTHILSFEGDAHVEWFEGNFEDYEDIIED